MLILIGINQEQYNEAGITCLHYAIDNDKDKSFNYLLQGSINCNIQDINGDTPLHYAVNLENEQFIIKLLAKGADPNINNNSGESVLNIVPKSLKHLFK